MARFPGHTGFKLPRQRRYGTCAECHKLEKLKGFICYVCSNRIERSIYQQKPERKAKAHDNYIKRKNKLAFVPQEASVGIGKGCLLNTVNTK